MIVDLLSGVTQLPVVTGDTTTQISFSVSNVTNPSSMDQSSTFQFYFNTSNQVNQINQRLTGVTVTNSQSGALTNVSVSPEDSSLGVTTSYLISFLPSTAVEQNTIVTVQIPSQIGIDTSSTLSCTSVLVIESTLSCSYESSNSTVTVTSGFLSKTSYVQSQVEFRISNMINPSTAITTDSFVIQTLTSSLTLYDSISSGVTYTESCNSP